MANYYVNSVAYAAVQTWSALEGVLGLGGIILLGTFVRQTSPTTGNERVFKCTTSGTIDNAEPTWNLTYGATTTETGHTGVWTCLGGQEADQSAGNWTAPMARFTQFTGGSNAQSSHPLAAGDKIFVSSDHAETQAAGVNIGPLLDNITVLSVTRSGANLPPISADLTRGASINVTGNNQMLGNWDSIYWWGVDFIAGSGSIEIRNDGYMCEYFENGSFQTGSSNGLILGADSASVAGSVVFDNTYVKFGNASASVFLSWMGFEWKNTASAVQGTVPNNLFGAGSGPIQGNIYIHGVDLSHVTSNLFAVSSVFSGVDVDVRDCKLANGVGICGTSNSGWNGIAAGFAQIMVDNCDDSTNDRNFRMFRSTPNGAVQQTTALIRTGGNTDGVTQFAWQMINTSSGTPLPLTIGSPARFPKIAQRYNTTGSSKTLTLYGISSFSTIPTNAKMWIDVDYLGSSATPIATLVTSRVADALAVGTNLTADTSSWNTNVAARQNSHAYSVGALISVADCTAGCTFICTGAGTSNSSEPAGYAAAVDGGAVSDGTATFTAMWRWSIAVTFTPELAGTIKCTPKTLLAASMNPTANLLVIDPSFTIA